MNKPICLFLLIAISAMAHAEYHELDSPDGTLRLRFELRAGRALYSLRAGEEDILVVPAWCHVPRALLGHGSASSNRRPEMPGA